MLSRIPLASKTVVVGGLAAVSLTVTGVALAVPGGPFSPVADTVATSASPTVTPTGTPTEDSAKATDSDSSTEPAETESPEPSESPKADRTCPWPVPSATATAMPTASAAPHDNGLHCGWYKPGHRDGEHPGDGHDGRDSSSPRPHPTGAPAEHGKSTTRHSDGHGDSSSDGSSDAPEQEHDGNQG